MGDYEICYEVSDTNQNKAKKVVPVHVISDGERKIQRTLYTLPKINHLNITGFTRGNEHEIQDLGIYLPKDTSVLAKQLNENGEDLTVQFINNDCLKESLSNDSVTSGTGGNSEETEFMKENNVKVNNTNKIITAKTDDYTKLENVVSVSYWNKNTTSQGINYWDKYNGKSFDSIPIVKTLYGDNIENPIIEITLNDNVEPLDYYTYGDDMDAFKENWKKSQHKVGLIEGNRASIIVPYDDLECLGKSKRGLFLKDNIDEYINDDFNNIDNILTYYDDIVEEYDEWVGLDYNASVSTDLNVKTKFLIKADSHGYAGAYYTSNQYISVNDDSLDVILHKKYDGWMLLHEMAHGYQGNMVNASGNNYDQNLKNGKLYLQEVSNNILAYYYQKENLQGSWFGNIADMEKAIMQNVREKEQSYLILGGNEDKGIEEAEIYHLRLYAYINLLNKIGPKQSMADLYRYYREETMNNRDISKNYVDMFTKGLSDSSKYNVIPYLQNWKVQISKDVEGEIYSKDYPIVYFLRDLVKDDEKAERIRSDLNLEGIYSLVSNDDIRKYNFTGNLNLSLSEEDFNVLKGSNIAIKSGKNVVRKIEVNSNNIIIGDLPIGAYEIEIEKEGKILTPRYAVVKQDDTSEITITTQDKVLIKLEITTPPNKVNYVEGEDFEQDGMIVTAFYDEGSSKQIKDYDIVNIYKNLLKGQKNIKIRYEEDGISKTAEQEITVDEKLVINLNKYQEKMKNETTYLESIQPNTSLSQLKNNIETNGDIQIFKGETQITDENQKIGTGMIIKITKNKQQKIYTAVVIGDLNGDGTMGDIDLLKLARHQADLDNTLNGAYLEATDIYRDGIYADNKDLLKMARVLVELEDL